MYLLSDTNTEGDDQGGKKGTMEADGGIGKVFMNALMHPAAIDCRSLSFRFQSQSKSFVS